MVCNPMKNEMKENLCDLVLSIVSDDYENFDDTAEGDSGTIQRSVGEGPVETINWAISLSRLLLGTPAAEISARSSSLDEPLTPTNFNLKAASTQGSSAVDALRMDKNGIFVQRSQQRLFELSYDLETNDYKADDLTLLVPELNAAGIVHIAIQRQPDTRIHCVRADGTVGALVFDKAENVICWLELETAGEVEDISILPGTAEDRVYYTVKRTVNGSTVRYREKWALESECVGGMLNKQADAFAVYDSTATTTITGFSHLEGEELVVWADGKDVGSHTVSGGVITLETAASQVVAGLPYMAQWKSMKNAFAAALGTPLNQVQRVSQLGLILLNAHALGIRMGSDFDHLDDIPLDDLPTLDNGDPDTDHVFDVYDQNMFAFNDQWSTDSRLCLEAAAPRPCTVLCATVSTTTHG